MKTPLHSSRAHWCTRSILPALAAVVWLPLQASASTNIYWDAVSGNNQLDAGSGTWDTDDSSNLVWTTSSTGDSNTYWTTGTGMQAVFSGSDAAAGTYIVSIASDGVQAQTLRVISSGYIFTASTSATISLGYGAGTGVGSGISVGTGVTVTVGDNVTLVSGTAGSQPLTLTGSGTIIISASSASSVATVKAGVNNNVNINGGVTVVVGTNGVLQTGTTSTDTGSLVIGTDTTNATLTVDGGTVNFKSLVLGNAAATGVSTLNIESGTVASTYSGGVLRFGSTTAATSGTAIVNLDGGTLSVNGITVGNSSSAASYQIYFNGGVLQALSSSSTFFASSSHISASVMGGGAIIDTNGYDITIAQALVSGTTNDGGLTKEGTGTLTLTGANTYTGKTTVKAGTLAVGVNGTISNTLVLGGTDGSTGILDVTAKGSGATFSESNISGNGSIVTNAGTVIADGVVSPGFGEGATDISLNVTGNFTLASTASTTLDIAGSSDFDKIIVSGTLTYGGSLTISSYDGYDLTLSGSYDLFDSSAISGTFASVTVNGVSLSYSDGIWSDASSTYSLDQSTGVLSVVPEPSTYAILVGGLGMLGLWRRKSRA